MIIATEILYLDHNYCVYHKYSIRWRCATSIFKEVDDLLWNVIAFTNQIIVNHSFIYQNVRLHDYYTNEGSVSQNIYIIFFKIHIK